MDTSDAECSAKTIMIDRQCSPIMLSVKNSDTESMVDTISKSISSSSHSEYQPAEKMSELLEKKKELKIKQGALLLLTNYFIDTDLKNYIGVPCKWL